MLRKPPVLQNTANFFLFSVFSIDTAKAFCYIIQVGRNAAIAYGGIAQLGERLNGIQEVSGSIPLISTTFQNRKALKSKGFGAFLYFLI